VLTTFWAFWWHLETLVSPIKVSVQFRSSSRDTSGDTSDANLPWPGPDCHAEARLQVLQSPR
jgi:hypothetical protein